LQDMRSQTNKLPATTWDSNPWTITGVTLSKETVIVNCNHSNCSLGIRNYHCI